MNLRNCPLATSSQVSQFTKRSLSWLRKLTEGWNNPGLMSRLENVYQAERCPPGCALPPVLAKDGCQAALENFQDAMSLDNRRFGNSDYLVASLAYTHLVLKIEPDHELARKMLHIFFGFFSIASKSQDMGKRAVRDAFAACEYVALFYYIDSSAYNTLSVVAMNSSDSASLAGGLTNEEISRQVRIFNVMRRYHSKAYEALMTQAKKMKPGSESGRFRQFLEYVSPRLGGGGRGVSALLFTVILGASLFLGFCKKSPPKPDNLTTEPANASVETKPSASLIGAAPSGKKQNLEAAPSPPAASVTTQQGLTTPLTKAQENEIINVSSKPGYLKITSSDGRLFWGKLLATEVSRITVLHENGQVFQIPIERLNASTQEQLREEEKKLPSIKSPVVALLSNEGRVLNLEPLMIEGTYFLARDVSGVVQVMLLSQLSKDSVRVARSALDKSKLKMMAAGSASSSRIEGLVPADWKTATTAKLTFVGMSGNSLSAMSTMFGGKLTAEEVARLNKAPSIEQSLAERTRLDEHRSLKGLTDPRMREIFFEKEGLGKMLFEVFVYPDAFSLWPNGVREMIGQYYELRALPDGSRDYIFIRLTLNGELDSAGFYQGTVNGDVIFRGTGDGTFGDGLIVVSGEFKLQPYKAK